jgi:hypothetical protein
MSIGVACFFRITVIFYHNFDTEFHLLIRLESLKIESSLLEYCVCELVKPLIEKFIS